MKSKKVRSCWKNMDDLGNMIQNGFEVPNCIPDSAYKLNEAQVFVNNKNRELQSKYKKVKQWLDDTIASGDKDYAEKLLVIIDRWRQSYEDKIRSAKSLVKEGKSVDIQIPDIQQHLSKNERKIKEQMRVINDEIEMELKEFKERLFHQSQKQL